MAAAGKRRPLAPLASGEDWDLGQSIDDSAPVEDRVSADDSRSVDTLTPDDSTVVDVGRKESCISDATLTSPAQSPVALTPTVVNDNEKRPKLEKQESEPYYITLGGYTEQEDLFLIRADSIRDQPCLERQDTEYCRQGSVDIKEKLSPDRDRPPLARSRHIDSIPENISGLLTDNVDRYTQPPPISVTDNKHDAIVEPYAGGYSLDDDVEPASVVTLLEAVNADSVSEMSYSDTASIDTVRLVVTSTSGGGVEVTDITPCPDDLMHTNKDKIYIHSVNNPCHHSDHRPDHHSDHHTSNDHHSSLDTHTRIKSDSSNEIIEEVSVDTVDAYQHRNIPPPVELPVSHTQQTTGVIVGGNDDDEDECKPPVPPRKFKTSLPSKIKISKKSAVKHVPLVTTPSEEDDTPPSVPPRKNMFGKPKQSKTDKKDGIKSAGSGMALGWFNSKGDKAPVEPVDEKSQAYGIKVPDREATQLISEDSVDIEDNTEHILDNIEGIIAASEGQSNASKDAGKDDIEFNPDWDKANRDVRYLFEAKAVARPRSTTPINLATMDDYLLNEQPEKSPSTDKIRIVLPGEEFDQRQRSPRKSQSRVSTDDAWFHFNEEHLFCHSKASIVTKSEPCNKTVPSPKKVLVPRTSRASRSSLDGENAQSWQTFEFDDRVVDEHLSIDDSSFDDVFADFGVPRVKTSQDPYAPFYANAQVLEDSVTSPDGQAWASSQ